MAIYQYSCRCGNKFDKLMRMSDISIVYCPKCKKEAKKDIATGIRGLNGNAEPWEYEFTHRVKPKTVTDSKGNKQKFNPNTMTKGRKGGG